MKIVLADLASECFDESIEFGEYNEMTAKIQRRVLAQIKDDQRRKHFAMRQALSIAIIAAVLVSLLTVTAYALGLFKLNKNLITDDYIPRGRWIERDSAGQIINIQDMDYPDANRTKVRSWKRQSGASLKSRNSSITTLTGAM